VTSDPPRVEKQNGPFQLSFNLYHYPVWEVLDRVLNKGVILIGEVGIPVADIDLIYIGLQVVLTSMETARQGSCPTSADLSSWVGLMRTSMREE
jgi:hypothetical protein